MQLLSMSPIPLQSSEKAARFMQLLEWINAWFKRNGIRPIDPRAIKVTQETAKDRRTCIYTFAINEYTQSAVAPIDTLHVKLITGWPKEYFFYSLSKRPWRLPKRSAIYTDTTEGDVQTWLQNLPRQTVMHTLFDVESTLNMMLQHSI